MGVQATRVKAGGRDASSGGDASDDEEDASDAAHRTSAITFARNVIDMSFALADSPTCPPTRNAELIHLADVTEEVIETKSSLSALRPMVCELYVVAIREAARSDIESVLDSSLFGKASRKALGNARPSVKFLERMEALMRVVLEVVTYH